MDEHALLCRYYVAQTTTKTSTDTNCFTSNCDRIPEMDNMADNPTQHRLYVINRGGTGEVQYLLLNKSRTEIESYCLRYNTWKVIKHIAYFGVAVVDNVLYIIGGYDVINCRHLHRVIKYDPFDTTWTECAGLLKSRSKFGICVLDGKIYVVGGERSDGQASCSGEIYDPDRDVWTEMGVMPAPRKNHCCAVYQNELYCAGGDFGTQSHDNFWRYDPYRIYEKNNWEELDPECPVSMPRCIDRAAMATVGNKIYVIGGVSCRGQGPEGNYKFTTERALFSYTSNVSAINRQRSHLQPDMISPWSTRYPSMTRPRHSCATYVIGSKIYVFGGCHLDTGQDTKIVECFDTTTGKWEEDFRFRRGDLSNVVCGVLEVPRRHDDKKINYHLKWVLW